MEYELGPDDLKSPQEIYQEARWAAGEQPLPTMQDFITPQEMEAPEATIWKLVDWLNRGEYISANTARYLYGKENWHPVKAFLGEQKTTYSDIGGDLGLDGAAKAAFGIAGSIFADPFLPARLGSLSKAGRLAGIVESQTKALVELEAKAIGKNGLGMIRELKLGGEWEKKARQVAQTIAKADTELGKEMQFALDNHLDILKLGTSWEEQAARKQRFFLTYMGQPLDLDFVNRPLLRWGDKAATFMNTSPLPKWFKGIFSSDVYIPGDPEKTAAVNEARRRSLDRGRDFAARAIEGTEGWGKLLAKLPGAAHDEVANLLETAGEAELRSYLRTKHGFTETEAADFWKEGRTALDDLWEYEQATGIAKGEGIGLGNGVGDDVLDEQIDDVRYVPHLLTDEGKKLFFGDGARPAPQDLPKWISSHVSNKDRMFVDPVSKRPWTLREIQKMAETDGLWVGDRFYKPSEIKGKKIFSTDLKHVYATRYLRTARALNAKMYMDDLAEGVGAVPPVKVLEDTETGARTFSHRIPFGWVQPRDNPYWRKSKIGNDFVAWYVPPEVAKLVDETFSGLTNSAELEKAAEWVDKLTGAWKASTLALFPAYHLRNLTGNAWQYFVIGGHKDMGSLLDGFKLSLENKHYGRFSRDNPFDTVRIGGESLPADWTLNTMAGERISKQALWEEIKSRGIAGGQYVAENAAKAADGIKKMDSLWQKYAPWDAKARYYQRGFEIGSKYVEDPFRIGAYVHYRRMGFSADAASLQVKSQFYDYFDLTKTERMLFRRVFPFYAWTRKNIPRQIEALLEQPAKFGKLAALRNNVEEREAIRANPIFVPEWMQAGMPLQIRKNPKTGEYEYLLMNGWLPAGDVAQIFDPKGLFSDLLNPILKEPYQSWIRNFDGRYNREIERFGGERVEFLNMPVPARMAHALRNVRMLTFFDRIMSGKGTLTDKAETGAKSFFLGGQLYGADLEKAKRNYILKKSKELSETRREITRQSNDYRSGRKRGATITNIRTLALQERKLEDALDRIRRTPTEVPVEAGT